VVRALRQREPETAEESARRDQILDDESDVIEVDIRCFVSQVLHTIRLSLPLKIGVRGPII
jgi:hypothetical protein